MPLRVRLLLRMRTVCVATEIDFVKNVSVIDENVMRLLQRMRLLRVKFVGWPRMLRALGAGRGMIFDCRLTARVGEFERESTAFKARIVTADELLVQL